MSSLEELLSEPLAALKDRFFDQRMVLPDGFLEALSRDPRHGAQELASKIRTRRQKDCAEDARLENLLHFEAELWSEGINLIAGVDEAGMGPLAGPVAAAAVIFPKGYKLPGLNDSKKIMSEAKRTELARQIKVDSLSWSVGWAEVEEIDRLNIYHAGRLAMRRAVEGLTLRPEFVLVDGRKIPQCPSPQRGIPQGDTLSASIAAASIIAKTMRDEHMAELDQKYPGYGLASHKGYPTAEHCGLLKELGALPIHRRSYRLVRQVLGLEPVQAELFGNEGEASIGR